MLGVTIHVISESEKNRLASTFADSDSTPGWSSRFVASKKALLGTFLVSVLVSHLAGLACSSFLVHGKGRTPSGFSKGVSTPDHASGTLQWMSLERRSTASPPFGANIAPPQTCEVEDSSGELAKQSLMVDVKNVHAEWLSSEERIVDAMAEILEHIDRSVSSYSCDVGANVLRCVGLADESNVLIQTWPILGAFSVDVVARASTPLMDILPLLEEKLEGSHTVPRLSWAQKARGSFGDGVDRTLSEAGVGRLAVSKRRATSVTSIFQHIHVWDMQRPRLSRSNASAHNDQQSFYGLEGPMDRIVFLDDTCQSRRFGDAGYHETLVHPVMFAHDNPVRVAIIGGGEGATLREVLKHNTVEKVVMIEIDEVMVNVSREFLPEWSYCGNLVGSAVSCFDDPRTEVHFEDAIAWFTDHFLDDEALDPKDQFDIVIMDALDPSTVVAFSDVLYKSNDLVLSLYNSLTKNGLFVIQCGQSSHATDPPVTHLQDDQVHTLVSNFEAVGFESMQKYDEAHGGFEAPWSFLAVMKSIASRDTWFRNEAEVEWSIRARASQTLNGDSPFRYFDGSSMMGWKYSNRVEEGVHCRLDPVPFGCDESGSSPGGWESLVDALLGNLTQGSHRAVEDWKTRVYIDPSVTRLVRDLSQATNLDRWAAVADLLRESEICRSENDAVRTHRLALGIEPALYVFDDRIIDRRYPPCGSTAAVRYGTAQGLALPQG